MPAKAIVLVDEALGDAEGELGLHFQFAVGDVDFDKERKQVSTAFDDANILVWSDSNAPVILEEEEGWFAWKYGHRKPRPAFRYRHTDTAPAAFLTLICPYRGTDEPTVAATLPEGFRPGSDRVEIRVKANAKTYQLGRDLKAQQAWSNPGG